MSAPKDMNFGHLAAAINGITNVETIAITSKAVIMPYSNAHIVVVGVVEFTNGAGGAGLTLKLYRGVDLTGTQVLSTGGVTAAAASTLLLPIMFEEDVAAAAQLQYTISVTDSVNQAGNNIVTADIAVWVL